MDANPFAHVELGITMVYWRYITFTTRRVSSCMLVHPRKDPAPPGSWCQNLLLILHISASRVDVWDLIFLFHHRDVTMMLLLPHQDEFVLLAIGDSHKRSSFLSVLPLWARVLLHAAHRNFALVKIVEELLLGHSDDLLALLQLHDDLFASVFSWCLRR